MIWEESFLSFWVTIVFLTLGTISIVFPMASILQFICRMIIWLFFGPWMKIVDIIFVSKTRNESENRKREANSIEKRSKIARIKREEALKLQKMKVMKYGDYIIPVPAFNVDRHYDRPLADSTARPDSKKDPSLFAKEIKDIGLIPGQQLYGVMIPRAQKEMEQNREESRATKGHIIDLLHEFKLNDAHAEECADDYEMDEISESVSDIMSVGSNTSITISECETYKSEGFEIVLNKSSKRQDVNARSLDQRITISRTESIDTSLSSSHLKTE